MQGSIAMTILIFLGAAIIMVPLGKKLGLSSVIGYILGGILIGPFCLQLTGRDAEDIMHASELGVIMLLFLVGLELEPQKLWQIRKRIIGLGVSQMLLSIVGIFIVFYIAGFGLKKSFIISLCFAMSSTAIVLQTLKEKNLFRTVSGESSFSILLFQDIAVIPILALLPFISKSEKALSQAGHEKVLLQYLPEWLQPFTVIFAVIALILLGRYIFTPFLRFVSRSGLNELLTAASLFLVIGVSELMISVDLSPALGAFIAGVMLANSEFRHELESAIDPFKGLLLAVFFVSVGATINFDIIASKPFFIFSAAFIVLAIKAVVLFAIGKYYKMNNEQSFFLAFALSQVGEFAFVLVNFAASLYLIDYQANSELMAIVAITMCISPLLLIFKEKVLDKRFIKQKTEENIELGIIKQRKVIIVGFGFFGSTVGRLLKANGIRSTVLDNDPDRVALLRSNGFNVYYGDATKPALLRSAGIEDAELLVLCLDDPEKNKFLVDYAKENYPELKIFVRAKNRLDAYDFLNKNVNHIYRETLGTAVDMAVDILQENGMRKYTARRMGKRFMLIDKAMTRRLAKEKDKDMITFTLRESLEREAELLALDSISFEENHWSGDGDEDDK
ncbi:monovalent cation:proton antiporter-2 (CPA2) family protein [Epilithonimonas hungarica]|uniref:Kef-type potassium/proton antiporter, CPA2 family n=1 Tax=Epilithonimonas hungarica TaxID=454006 RepID=A0A1G7NB21_9FLAO|nr:monovalent cation:proton antiporter-2 (CPA2) family protein [Epilithonimonas hungarica]SDF71111.1 Kef-type potassium/proton antiporter, CPA2 family [Epilithonimonas hungarica]